MFDSLLVGLTTYNLQEYSVISTEYGVLLEVTGTGAFQKRTPQFEARDPSAARD